MIKILFLLKQRTEYCFNDYEQCEEYGEYSNSGTMMGYGLYNSSTNVANMLNANGFHAEVEFVIDGNYIDSVVHQKRPNFVILEAIWCPPNKFNELVPLHPYVTWIIRVHSETPFIANEGHAYQFLFEYLTKPNVYLAFNSQNIYNEFLELVSPSLKHRILYLPNHYEGVTTSTPSISPQPNTINIGCFGAIRPMKNHLIQGVASILYANKKQKNLNFHINAGRIEQRGENPLKNLRALFQQFPQHTLVEHPWMPHEEFVNVIASMDVCLQVSFSETFNIVTADAVVNNIPIVVSKEVKWINRLFYADVTNSKTIVDKIEKMIDATALQKNRFTTLNKIGLKRYNNNAKRVWIKFLTTRNI